MGVGKSVPGWWTTDRYHATAMAAEPSDVSALDAREELLTVPGVAAADVGESDGPAGVRIQLSHDADPELVSAEVQRILASHGLSSQIAAAEPVESPGPPPPPGAPVVSLTHLQRGSLASQGPGGISGVSVEESPDGVIVIAHSTSGALASRKARGTQEGLNEAVVATVAELYGLEPPKVVAIEQKAMGGSNVATVVVELVDGSRLAGASVVEGGTPFAVGKATWAAFSSGA